MGMRSSGRQMARVLAVATTVALAVTACGSQGQSGGQDAPTVDTAALLGPAKKAAGDPVTIGFITGGKTPSIDNTPAQHTAHAAVKYVNEHLGGVAGRPIKLFVCETHETPAGNADCANQMVDRKMPVVLNDITGNGGAVDTITSAGIPYVTWSASSHVALTTKGSYSITGALASLVGGLAQYSKKQGITKVAVLGIDVPAVTQGLHSVGKPVFQKAGVDLEITSIPPGTPDILPQVQSAISDQPGALFIFGTPNMCASGLKAARNLAYPGKLYIEEQCIDPSTMGSVPDGYKGVVVPSVVKMKDGTHEYDLYRAVLQKYSPDTAKADARSGIAVQGYGVVLSFARLMDKAGTKKITRDSVKSALAEAKDVPTPVASGADFTCDGDAVPRFPAICSVQTQIMVLNSDGEPTKYTAVDPTSLFH